MRERARKHRVSGLELNVVVEGDGPPVLLLHGFPDSLDLWRHQVPALVEAGFRVIAYDQRGYGDSDAPAGREFYTLDRAEADALALLDALGVEGKVSLVGHDWGAVVAWSLALHHPRRVERLVALSVGHPEAYRRAGLGQKLRAWYVLAFQIPGLAERMVRAGHWAALRRLGRDCGESGRWISDLSRPGRLTAALNWYRANLGPLLTAHWGRVPVPVTGIWSTRDPALVEAQMTGSARYVDGPWRYERLEEVGHWIPLEAPERLNELLIRTLRSKSGAGS